MIDTHHLELMMGRDWRGELPPVCLECGYDLTGCVSDRCPECGIYFSRRELAEFINNLKLELRVLRSINDWIKTGFWLGSVALACLLLGWTFGRLWAPLLTPIIRVFACLFAFPAFCLSLSVLRILRLPAWSRQWISVPVRYELAFCAMLFSLLAGAGAFLLP